MRILLTGANGLLGQKLVKQLLSDSKHEFLASGRGEKRIPWDGVQYTSMDITDEKNVHEVIEGYHPDLVIHGAAMTQVDDCELNHEACDLHNVQAVENIVQACESVSAHLIFISTDFIFDGEDGPYAEYAEANPVNYYGLAKLRAEKIVMKSNLDWAILRTVLVYGTSYNPSRSNIVSWVRQKLSAGDSLNIVHDQERSPTWSNDLAAACLLAAEKRAQGVYHISGQDQMSILELTKRVARYYNLDENLIGPIDSKSLGQAAKRPPITGFVIDKAKNELNYMPHLFEESLRLMDEGQ